MNAFHYRQRPGLGLDSPPGVSGLVEVEWRASHMKIGLVGAELEENLGLRYIAASLAGHRQGEGGGAWRSSPSSVLSV